MNTRRAPEGAPFSYERYMSSMEFAESRGIPGSAVAAKAALYSDPKSRSFLFFLQSLSVQEGGMRNVAERILSSVPLNGPLPRNCKRLAHLLVEVCINPALRVSSSEASRLRETLFDFQRSYEAATAKNFVLTSIASEVFETLDHALDVGRMVVIEGPSGIGKTTAVEAWCQKHQGHARFVSLSGITHKTGFFQTLAMAIGLAASKRKATDMQVKVEAFFQKSRLMLVIDEAHYLWPQHERSHSSPELVNWVNTALANHNVPVALICTNQFAKLKARVERRTGWTSEQFEHRVKRYWKLPSNPTEEDIWKVATKLLAMRWDEEANRAWDGLGALPATDLVRLVVGYALTSKLPFTAVADAIQEARCQARKKQRSHVTAADLQAALLGYRIRSDAALANAELAKSRQSIPSLQTRCNRVAIGRPADRGGKSLVERTSRFSPG
jgi:hypothetical protein